MICTSVHTDLRRRRTFQCSYYCTTVPVSVHMQPAALPLRRIQHTCDSASEQLRAHNYELISSERSRTRSHTHRRSENRQEWPDPAHAASISSSPFPWLLLPWYPWRLQHRMVGALGWNAFSFVWPLCPRQRRVDHLRSICLKIFFLKTLLALTVICEAVMYRDEVRLLICLCEDGLQTNSASK